MKQTTPLPTIIFLISILLLSSYAIAQPSKNLPPQKTIHLDILYVDDDNIYGPWDGTLEHPYQHIQDAINAATPHDTIKIFSGTYHEHLIINKNLKIIGEKTNTTIINGQESHIIVQIHADDIYLRNLTIKNSDGNQTSTAIQSSNAPALIQIPQLTEAGW